MEYFLSRAFFYPKNLTNPSMTHMGQVQANPRLDSLRLKSCRAQVDLLHKNRINLYYKICGSTTNILKVPGIICGRKDPLVAGLNDPEGR